MDDQDPVICSEKFSFLRLQQGAMIGSEKDGKAKCIVSMYRKRSKNKHDLTMEDYFYNDFCKEVLKEAGDESDCTKHFFLMEFTTTCNQKQ